MVIETKELPIDFDENQLNSYAYNKERKRYLFNTGSIHCHICPYHRGENRTWKPYRSWKSKRKKHQWVHT